MVFDEYARIVDGVVIEIIKVPEAADIADCFVPEIADQCVKVDPGAVVQGQIYQDGLFQTAPEPPLEDVKKAARRALAEEINRFIAAKTEAEGGGKRYDQAWQTGALALKMDYQAALAAGGLSSEQETAINARLALIKSVQDWIYAVRGILFAKRAAINAAPDLAGVVAVTWDLSIFEIGAVGDGANPDPDVYMDQLVIA